MGGVAQVIVPLAIDVAATVATDGAFAAVAGSSFAATTEGAITIGAVSGAVGGSVSAAVTGGDPATAALTGAVTGGISGGAGVNMSSDPLTKAAEKAAVGTATGTASNLIAGQPFGKALEGGAIGGVSSGIASGIRSELNTPTSSDVTQGGGMSRATSPNFGGAQSQFPDTGTGVTAGGGMSQSTSPIFGQPGGVTPNINVSTPGLTGGGQLNGPSASATGSGGSGSLGGASQSLLASGLKTGLSDLLGGTSAPSTAAPGVTSAAQPQTPSPSFSPSATPSGTGGLLAGGGSSPSVAALAQALRTVPDLAYSPGGPVFGSEANGTPKKVWNKASLRVTDDNPEAQ